MAINWTDDRTGEKSVSHVGLVLTPPFRAEERVMSDIYSMVTRVWVWNPEKRIPETVVLNYGFELNSQTGVSDVDMTFDVAAAYEAYKNEQETAIRAAREKREREEADARAERARAAAHDASIVNGCTVLITSGKKADRSKTGIVFWKRDGRIGVQIGNERLPNGYAKDVVWTYTKNVTKI